MLIVALVLPLLQLYDGLFGLLTVTDAEPLLLPQDVAVALGLRVVVADGATVTLAVAVQLPALVTVTV